MPPITVRLSERAASALRGTAAEIGVSITALIEAVGLSLETFPNPITSTRLSDLARQTDFDRRQRGR